MLWRCCDDFIDKSQLRFAITKATWNEMVVYTFVKAKTSKRMGMVRNVTKSLLSKYVGDEEPAGHGTGIKGASKFLRRMGLPIKENYDDGLRLRYTTNPCM